MHNSVPALMATFSIHQNTYHHNVVFSYPLPIFIGPLLKHFRKLSCINHAFFSISAKLQLFYKIPKCTQFYKNGISNLDEWYVHITLSYSNVFLICMQGIHLNHSLFESSLFSLHLVIGQSTSKPKWALERQWQAVYLNTLNLQRFMDSVT